MNREKHKEYNEKAKETKQDNYKKSKGVDCKHGKLQLWGCISAHVRRWGRIIHKRFRRIRSLDDWNI